MLDTEGLISVVNEGDVVYNCDGRMLIPGQAQMVPTSFVVDYGAMKDLRFDFSSMADLLASRTEDGRAILDLWAPLSRVDGYGRHAIDLYRGMRELAEVRLRDVGWVDHIYLDSAIELDAQVNRQRVPSKVAVAFTLPYDPHIFNSRSLVKIALTQFETDRMPRVHVGNINKCDHLIVTSSFQVPVVRASGVRVPVSVMTPGVDTDFFTVRPQREDAEFRVLILGALTGRKNPLGAIEVFQRASQGDPSWRLTIKSRNADGIDAVQALARQDPRITVWVDDTHPDAILGYYHAHDCLLWPSKGEGVGLPPLEALSCGLEVVCSANSGMLDFIDERWAWPIRSARMEPAGWPDNSQGFSQEYVEQFGEVGNWWVPDLTDAVRQLQKAHKAWAGNNGKGRLGAAYVRREHTLRHQAESVLRVAEEYL